MPIPLHKMPMVPLRDAIIHHARRGPILTADGRGSSFEQGDGLGPRQTLVRHMFREGSPVRMMLVSACDASVAGLLWGRSFRASGGTAVIWGDRLASCGARQLAETVVGQAVAWKVLEWSAADGDSGMLHRENLSQGLLACMNETSMEHAKCHPLFHKIDLSYEYIVKARIMGHHDVAGYQNAHVAFRKHILYNTETIIRTRDSGLRGERCKPSESPFFNLPVILESNLTLRDFGFLSGRHGEGATDFAKSEERRYGPGLLEIGHPGNDTRRLLRANCDVWNGFIPDAFYPVARWMLDVEYPYGPSTCPRPLRGDQKEVHGSHFDWVLSIHDGEFDGSDLGFEVHESTYVPGVHEIIENIPVEGKYFEQPNSFNPKIFHYTRAEAGSGGETASANVNLMRIVGSHEVMRDHRGRRPADLKSMMYSSSAERRDIRLVKFIELLRDFGISDSIIDAAWPSWWSDDLSRSPSAWAELRFSFARKFGLSAASLLNNRVEFIRKGECGIENSIGKHIEFRNVIGPFALNLGRLLARAASGCGGFGGVPARELRRSILKSSNRVDAYSLIAACWTRGVPAVQLKVSPTQTKPSHAMIVAEGAKGAIMLGRDAMLPAQTAFILAYEIGRLALGHVESGNILVDVGNPLTSEYGCAEADVAGSYAIELLTGYDNARYSDDNGNRGVSMMMDASLWRNGEDGTDPGAGLICFGYQTKKWKDVIAALYMLHRNAAENPTDINSFARSGMDWDELGHDIEDFIHTLLGLNHERRIPP